MKLYLASVEITFVNQKVHILSLDALTMRLTLLGRIAMQICIVQRLG